MSNHTDAITATATIRDKLFALIGEVESRELRKDESEDYFRGVIAMRPGIMQALLGAADSEAAAPGEVDLDAIETRANAATPGPWLNADKKDIGKDWLIGSVIDCGTTLSLSDRIVTTDRLPGLAVTSGGANEDAEFIAHARTDIPAMIAELRQHRARAQSGEAAPVSGAEEMREMCLNEISRHMADFGDAEGELHAVFKVIKALPLPPSPVKEIGAAVTEAGAGDVNGEARKAAIEECASFIETAVLHERKYHFWGAFWIYHTTPYPNAAELAEAIRTNATRAMEGK